MTHVAFISRKEFLSLLQEYEDDYVINIINFINFFEINILGKILLFKRPFDRL